MNQLRSQLRTGAPLNIWHQCWWTLQTSSDTMPSMSQALMDSPHHCCNEECLSSSILASFLQTSKTQLVHWQGQASVTCPHLVSRGQGEKNLTLPSLKSHTFESLRNLEGNIRKSPYLSVQSSLNCWGSWESEAACQLKATWLLADLIWDLGTPELKYFYFNFGSLASILSVLSPLHLGLFLPSI